jgi:hypothetical protein
MFLEQSINPFFLFAEERIFYYERKLQSGLWRGGLDNILVKLRAIALAGAEAVVEWSEETLEKI